MCWFRAIRMRSVYALTSAHKGRTIIHLNRNATSDLTFNFYLSQPRTNLWRRTDTMMRHGYGSRIVFGRTRIGSTRCWHTISYIQGLPHDLGFITAQYTDHPHYKDEGQLWKEEGDIDAFWRYNVTDCCITRMVAEKMEAELLASGQHERFHNHVMRLQPELVQ